MLQSNAEQVFGLLLILSLITLAVSWWVTRTPAHKHKKP